MAEINLADTTTVTITNAVFVTPSGMTEIFMNNIGLTDATFTGSATGSTAVVLKPNSPFAYGYVGRGRRSISIDATGTSVEVSMTN
jgi:hypothetical protein